MNYPPAELRGIAKEEFFILEKSMVSQTLPCNDTPEQGSEELA